MHSISVLKWWWWWCTNINLLRLVFSAVAVWNRKRGDFEKEGEITRPNSWPDLVWGEGREGRKRVASWALRRLSGPRLVRATWDKQWTVCHISRGKAETSVMNYRQGFLLLSPHLNSPSPTTILLQRFSTHSCAGGEKRDPVSGQTLSSNKYLLTCWATSYVFVFEAALQSRTNGILRRCSNT